MPLEATLLDGKTSCIRGSSATLILSAASDGGSSSTCMVSTRKTKNRLVEVGKSAQLYVLIRKQGLAESASQQLHPV